MTKKFQTVEAVAILLGMVQMEEEDMEDVQKAPEVADLLYWPAWGKANLIGIAENENLQEN